MYTIHEDSALYTEIPINEDYFMEVLGSCVLNLKHADKEHRVYIGHAISLKDFRNGLSTYTRNAPFYYGDFDTYYISYKVKYFYNIDYFQCVHITNACIAEISEDYNWDKTKSDKWYLIELC